MATRNTKLGMEKDMEENDDNETSNRMDRPE